MHTETRSSIVLPAHASLGLVLALGGCPSSPSGDDGPSAAETGGDTGGETTAGVDESSGGEDPVQAAYFVFNRIQTPEGRTMFASILPQLDHGLVDVGEALELSGLSRGRIFNDKLYAFDGESGVITRFAIAEDGTLSPDALDDGSPAQVSFASLGISAFLSTVSFIDENRALYFDLWGDVVVDWNPTTMTIVDNFPAGLQREGFDISGGEMTRIDDQLVIPLSWQNAGTAEAIEVNAIGVVDLQDPTSIRVIEDARCMGTASTFVFEDQLYVMADNFGGLAVTLTDDELPPPCLLRWTPGADAFDADYHLDLSAHTGYQLVAGALSTGDGTFMTQVYTSDEDPSTLGLFELLDGDHWSRAFVSLDGETTIVEQIPPGAASSQGWIVDGRYLFPRADDTAGESTLFSFEDGTVSELLTVPGDLFIVDRVR
ncbi:MAG: hypothetical protein AAF799_27150 [Myxococcota bacterium]